MSADREQVRAWLEFLHGGSGGLIHIAPFGDWTGRAFAVDELDWAVDYVMENEHLSGVYARMTTLKAPLAPGKRGSAVDSHTLPALWADLDVEGPGHAEVGLLPDEAAAKAVIAHLPEPSVWVASGGGFYPVWKLAEPHAVTADLEALKALSTAWHRSIEDQAKRHGWKAAGTGDLARVLRIPGTINRKEGLARPCRVLEATGATYTLAELKAALRQTFTAPPALPAPSMWEQFSAASDDRPGDRYNALATWEELLVPAGWKPAYDSGGTRHWTRPGKEGRDGTSATTGHGDGDFLWVFSTSTVFETEKAYSKFAAYTLLHHGGDFGAAARAINDDPRFGTRPQRHLAVVADDAPRPPAPSVDSDAFWNARPELAHVRDFARARMCSPWAVLAVVLARVCAATPPHIVLPAIVGSVASLNSFFGFVGFSGAGKGASDAAGRDAVDVGQIAQFGVGSGEGIAHLYARRDKKSGEVIRDRDAVLFNIPEVDTLTALGDRRGATLLPQLRSAWSGEALGFAYADPTKALPIEQHTYRMALLLGIQPGRASPLLDDADGGTPQRFLWLPTTDRDAPDQPPAAPPPLLWEMPPGPHYANASGLKVMGVPDSARQVIVEARRAVLRGETGGLNGHALLAQLKVAALLALLDRRLDVNDQDWELSAVVMQVSDATRQSVADYLASKATVSNRARGEAEAARAAVVEDHLDDRRVQRVARLVARKLTAAGDWVTYRGVAQYAASRDRDVLTEALDRLVDSGQIEVVDDGGKPTYRAIRSAA